MPRRALPFEARVSEPTETGCREWLGCRCALGYGSLRYDGRMQKAHRVAWVRVHGPIPAGLAVCHRCDNPSCVNPDHLFLGTIAENNADRARKGRSRGTFASNDAHPARLRSGERHWCAKLSTDDVAAARKMYGAGRTQTDIARQFGVHPATISRIVRHVWRQEVAA